MIIIADRVLISATHKPLEQGAVVTADGKIVAYGPEARVRKAYPRHSVLALRNAVLMPGLVNIHTHIELPPLLEQVRGRGYAEWVMNLIREKKRLTSTAYARAAYSNCASLIRSGTTMVGDICTHGASPQALARSGLRAIVFHEIISMARRGDTVALPRLGRPRGLIRHGLSPHSPHTVSGPVLALVRRAALKRGLPVCMHVAETKDELLLLQSRKSGLETIYALAGWDTAWAPKSRSSFSYLERMGILGHRFLAVHAVQIDDEDIGIIARSGTAVAHCPRSNRALRAGTMPLRKLLRAGIPVGLGTDSLASVPSLSLWDEMRFAYRCHRLSGVTAKDILSCATKGGANALGMKDATGALLPGMEADCIAVPLPARNTGDLCSDLLRETKSCIMNMVNGKILYQQSRTQRK